MCTLVCVSIWATGDGRLPPGDTGKRCTGHECGQQQARSGVKTRLTEQQEVEHMGIYSTRSRGTLRDSAMPSQDA